MPATLADLEVVVRKLAQIIAADTDPQVVFQAVVTALTSTAGRPSVTLKIGTVTATGVFYAGDYHPVVNDTVLIVYTGSTPFVICPQTVHAAPVLAGVQSAAWMIPPAGGAATLGQLVAALTNEALLTDNTTPFIPPAVAAAATDPASTQALANSLRTILLALGLAQ